MASHTTRRFRRRNFQTLAEMPVKALGLSATRTRELRLSRAWAQVAGAKLAAHAKPIICRGARLELNQIDSDPVWAKTLLEIGATLAHDVAALSGERIRLVSVRLANGSQFGEREASRSKGAQREHDAPAASQPVEPSAARSYDPERLRSLMVRYLARFESSDGGGSSSDD
jgi:hypothetical protein